MEKRNLRGVHSGGSRGNDNIDHRNGSYFGGGGNFVGFNYGF